MAPSSLSRRQIEQRLHGPLFVVLLLAAAGLLGYLSTQYRQSFDWTAAGRHTLSDATLEALANLDSTVEVTVFASEDEALRREIASRLQPYRDATDRLRIGYVDPQIDPQRVREEGVRADGTVLFSLQGRKEKLTELNEQAVVNALIRLGRSARQQLVFVTGHGERSPTGQANHDLSTWGAALQAQGFEIDTWQFDGHTPLPAEAAAVVLTMPQTQLLPGEAEALVAHVAAGGNLLWLADPEPLRGLEPLTQRLGLNLSAGTVVDPVSQLFAGSAALVLATGRNYRPHPALRNFDLSTLFPFATRVDMVPGGDWTPKPLIEVAEQGWLEAGDLAAEDIGFDEQTDVAGPVVIALAMERFLDDPPALTGQDGAMPETADQAVAVGKTVQRILIFGDGDFLSNTYIGNGGNLELGTRLANWLAGEEELVTIAPKVASDSSLDLSPREQGFIGFGFLAGVPLLLIGVGGVTFLRRRRL